MDNRYIGHMIGMYHKHHFAVMSRQEFAKLNKQISKMANRSHIGRRFADYTIGDVSYKVDMANLEIDVYNPKTHFYMTYLVRK